MTLQNVQLFGLEENLVNVRLRVEKVSKRKDSLAQLGKTLTATKMKSLTCHAHATSKRALLFGLKENLVNVRLRVEKVSKRKDSLAQLGKTLTATKMRSLTCHARATSKPA